MFLMVFNLSRVMFSCCLFIYVRDLFKFMFLLVLYWSGVMVFFFIFDMWVLFNFRCLVAWFVILFRNFWYFLHLVDLSDFVNFLLWFNMLNLLVVVLFINFLFVMYLGSFWCLLDLFNMLNFFSWMLMHQFFFVMNFLVLLNMFNRFFMLLLSLFVVDFRNFWGFWYVFLVLCLFDVNLFYNWLVMDLCNYFRYCF